ncbi:ribonuclease H-like domain-containing protein [Tanacetum coccineum]
MKVFQLLKGEWLLQMTIIILFYGSIQFEFKFHNFIEIEVWAWMFLFGHLVWATGFMFLISWRGYWQELIETLAWAHERTPLANLIRWREKPVALSIVQARLLGLAHFSVGYILTYAVCLASIFPGLLRAREMELLKQLPLLLELILEGSWTWPTKKELGLTSPRWNVSTTKREDTLQGSAGHPGIKTSGTRSLQEELYDWNDQAEEGPTNFALMAYSSTSLSSSTNSEVSNDSNCCSSCLECVKDLKEQNEQLVKDLRTTRISDVSCKTSLESVEARLVVFKKNESVYEEDIKLLKLEIYLRDLDIKELKRKLQFATKEKDEVQLTVQKFENSSKNPSKLLDKQIIDKCKTRLGYNVVPPPYIGNFMPPKSDLVYPSLDNFVDVNESVSKHVVKKPTVETNEPKTTRKENGAPIIKDWVSESEKENVPKVNTVEMFNKHSFAKINFVKSTEQVKSPRKTSVGKNRRGKITGKGIENLIELKVKVIRCDNGTEFKNMVMNQFCEMKGIKREFSVARTPQQNGVAERKNRTLIKAARTMLADSKLPTTFWAEEVNTACYVQNRVLVIKPHNKTPYELFLGKKHALSFMRPFRCHVTILNTIDHLGKFNGKADEGFFIGYSTNSKAFRVFNSRTRIVEENLHVQFSKNKPNIAQSGPNWLFDIDALTKSINYKLVVAGNQSNGNASTDAEEPRINQEQDDNINSTNNINTASDGNNTNNVNAVSSSVNAVDPKTNIELPNDPHMPELEDIIYSDDDEDVGAEADMNNLDAFMPVSPILSHLVNFRSTFLNLSDYYL